MVPYSTQKYLDFSSFFFEFRIFPIKKFVFPVFSDNFLSIIITLFFLFFWISPIHSTNLQYYVLILPQFPPFSPNSRTVGDSFFCAFTRNFDSFSRIFCHFLFPSLSIEILIIQIFG